MENKEIESMLRPYDADIMETYPVDRSITRLGFNTTNPDVLNNKDYKRITAIDIKVIKGEKMITRTFQKTGEQISLLGFGLMRLPTGKSWHDINYKKAEALVDYAYTHGINYYDTAYGYLGGQSEVFAGNVLSKYPRNSFKLATKMNAMELKTIDDPERIFKTQLERCEVEYFDFYLMHGLNKDSFEKHKAMDSYGFLSRMRDDGKIRNLGFSFHDKPPVLEEILDTYQYDFAQIQLNYLDWEMQNAKELYKILESRHIQCNIMEPVRGGALATLGTKGDAIFKVAHPERSTASWAIRFAASLPNVLTVLSGMNEMEQMVDNVSTMRDFVPLTKDEYQVIEKALAAYNESVTIPCTGCRYCMDCLQGVDIPALIKYYNQYLLGKGTIESGFRLSENLRALGDSAGSDRCIACGECVKRCPQGIDIPGKMAAITEALKHMFPPRP